MAFSIGIDLGTSSVKVTAINEQGEILGQQSSDYNINRPKPNWAEQNLSDWKRSVFLSLKNLIKNLNTKKEQIEIKSIGVSGQMHGLVALDKKGEPVYPAIIWADNRTKEEVNIIDNRLSLLQKKQLNNPIVTSFTAPKLLWLKKNLPNVWSEVDKFILPKDYIVYLLTDIITSEKSDASATLLFDIEKGFWAENIIDELDLPRSIFPELLEPGSKVGKLKNDLYKKFGLKGNRPVVITAGGDAPVAALAAGATDADSACISLGTAGQIIMPFKSFISETQNRLHTLYYSEPSTWYLMGAILSASYNLSWWIKDICEKKESEGEFLKAHEHRLASLPPGANGLIYVPYIQGERSPHNDPDASGLLFGLKSDHSNSNIIKAMMEGVAFAIRNNYEIFNELGLEPEQIYLTGGGAKSHVWGQIFADILNKPVSISDKAYDTSYGAALLASHRVGDIIDYKEVIKENTTSYKHLYPRPDSHDIYNEIYSIFCSLYTDNKEKMNELSKLTRQVNQNGGII